MAPKRATSSKALAAAKPSTRARQEEPREDDFFLDSDNDLRSEDDGSDEDVETAEQKRLRLGAALPMAHAGGAPSGCQAPAPPARGRAPSFMNS